VLILHKTESHKKVFHHDIKRKFPTRSPRPWWEQRVKTGVTQNGKYRRIWGWGTDGKGGQGGVFGSEIIR